MLKQHCTKEGESYVSMQALDVEVPAVMLKRSFIAIASIGPVSLWYSGKVYPF